MATKRLPTVRDIEEARERLAGVAQVTPVYGSETLSRLAGREVWLKAENLQRTGSFKVRGAVNRIATLDAGASARRASSRRVRATTGRRSRGPRARRASRARIYVPLDAPMAKVEACQNYGAELVLAGELFEDAMEAAREYVEETGATFVHPFEDPLVIAGQGTIGLELAEQMPDAATVLIPVGGGGLAAGIATALRAVSRTSGSSACRPASPGFTIADGIFVKHPGELTMSILDSLLDDMVHVADEEISEAIVLLLERSKLVVEGAGAVGVAALLAGKAGGEGPAVAVLSGGNIDPTLLISVMRHGLTVAGRYLVVRTRIPDRPGELIKLLQLCAEKRVNVISVEHHREGMHISVAETEVELTVGDARPSSTATR